jgi:hypothetical protein
MIATRLVLTVIWFALAAYLLFFRPAQGILGPWAGWFALLFAFYNLARWWTERPRGLPPPPPHRRRRPHDAPPYLDEYNEIFDFEKDRAATKKS